MGQSAGAVLGVAGAVIGGVLTGGAGFAIEAGLIAGTLLGAILFPKKGPTPADIRIQDSAYGKFIPRVWGRYRLSGNLIWAGQPTQHDASGKGAGGKQNQPYVSMSFAVALCEGPIVSIQRIWANGELIYDVSNPDDFESLSGSTSMVGNFTVYPGDENQNPDPTMQAYLGVANVPAYRGLAYVVFNDLSLQQWGNYIPSLSFEVVAGGTASYVRTTPTDVPGAPALSIGRLYNVNTIPTQFTPNGMCYGVQWAELTSDFLIHMIGYQTSASGTTWLGSPIALGAEFPYGYGYSYDEPGVMCSDRYYYPIMGGVPLFTNIPNFGALTSGSWCKRNGVIYVTSVSVNSPLYICKNPLPKMAALLVTPIASNRTGNYKIAGVSDSYVYVMEMGIGSTLGLLRFDLDGSYVSTLTTNRNFAADTYGYVVSDTEIYIAWSSPLKHRTQSPTYNNG